MRLPNTVKKKKKWKKMLEFQKKPGDSEHSIRACYEEEHDQLQTVNYHCNEFPIFLYLVSIGEQKEIKGKRINKDACFEKKNQREELANGERKENEMKLSGHYREHLKRKLLKKEVQWKGKEANEQRKGMEKKGRNLID